jgi:multiple antibiotic resistance protein
LATNGLLATGSATVDYSEYIKIFIGLLAIVNPFGAIPMFISMTADETPDQRRATTNHVAMGLTIILLVSLFAGDLLLRFFGITIDSFRVGGGILVLLMAISMLQAKTSPIKQTDEEADESIQKESVAIVPLASWYLAVWCGWYCGCHPGSQATWGPPASIS